jgi:hypothetical protein
LLRSKTKRSEIQVYFFTFFHFFSQFFAFFHIFFAFFHFKFSLRFDLVIFASKQNKAKRNSSLFFSFFRFFSLFFAFSRFIFTFFHLIFISLRFFHLIFAYFTFVFASDFWCFASKWIKWNQAFFSLPSEAKVKAKVRAHPSGR